ncbi:HAD family hydrolase [Bacillus sp. FJAT-45037]|uniref:HAD family hydrolase n=1 Tax=Bacillus sp. FJAT-45037 TaxID=2011007 RepID=UPI000C24C543|nr:HAD family hydrolase [Bacillus sp. FJAT-45037]
MLEQYKLVIFDLDGTLYEGTDHFDYYAEHLKQKVEESQQELFDQEYSQMKAGKHPVKIGKAYDVARDLILTIDPMTLLVTEACKWDGEVLSKEETNNLYNERLSFDFESMIAIGDGWWLPFVAAKHFGVEDCYSSYIATKEFMVSSDFQLDPLPGLKEALQDLKTKTKMVLVTNSDADDVGRLLNELELTQLFEEVVTSAKKPTHTTRIFNELIEKYQVNEKDVISIGDNFINDVAPAILQGMQGVYIHPKREKITNKSVQVVSTVLECFPKS